MDTSITTQKKRIVFVLIDGLGDLSLPQLDFKTPLQCAETPMLDAIAGAGLNGLLDPVEPGLACGSDTAHMSIFGYEPRKFYRGRGSFEAMGAGLHMNPGDVAFKCNFATISKKPNGSKIVEKRRVDRNFPQWGKELCPFLDGTPLPSFPDVHIRVQYATEHRCGVVIRGDNLSDGITGTDPLKDKLELITSKPFVDSEAARRTSQILNEITEVFYEKLSSHPLNIARVKDGKAPANMVLLRGPGERINVTPFAEKHCMKAFMIAPTCIISGLGMSLGMDILKSTGGTGDYHSDLLSKATRAIEAFQDTETAYDFGFIHIKAVDDAGHDKDVEKKIHFIEASDRMIQHLVHGLHNLDKNNFSIVVTGDHTTPVIYGDHSFEPVPFAMCDVSEAVGYLENPESYLHPLDPVQEFSEMAAFQGFLGRFPGSQVLELIRRFSGRWCN